MTRRKVLILLGLGVVLLTAVTVAWAAMNSTALQAYWAARQLRMAPSDEERARVADRLAVLGDHGLARLVEFIRAGDEASRAAATAAVQRRLEAMASGDPWALTATERLCAALGSAEAAGQHAILELVPKLLARAGPSGVESCRIAVASGLTGQDPQVRVAAIRLTMHPDIKMRREVLPLLADPAAEVRSAALIVTAMPGDGEAILSDEDLFRWLHDPSETVRRLCRDALVSRNRTEMEIALGRRLVDPDPRQRLLLLFDLRHNEELADPEPWLERLSRDIEPAVRAGAARAAVEIRYDRRLACPAWVERIADTDPDPTVRRVVAYFRQIPLHAAAGTIRPAGGP